MFQTINVAAPVIAWLLARQQSGHAAYYVFVSTDQGAAALASTQTPQRAAVHDGLGAPYHEVAEPRPPTRYGRIKLDAERRIAQSLAKGTYAILRSTVILGPQPMVAGAHNTPLQFLAAQLRRGARVQCFLDEFRFV